MSCYGIFRGPVGPTGPTGPDGPTGPAGPTAIGQAYIQGFGCQTLSSLAGAFCISPFDWETNATNAAASTAVTALFPLQGGAIESLSIYYVVASIPVSVDWALRIDGSDTAMAGTIASGSQGPLYVNTPVQVVAAGVHIIQLKGIASAPNNTIIRVRAVITGYLNPP